jgi:hypothetical protein
MASGANPTSTNADALLTLRAHQEALFRRRIKFVVEKGSMARLFKAGMHGGLQEELFHCLTPETVVSPKTQEDYDRWLLGVIQSERWEPYSRNGLAEDRWGYFAKLINIITYEMLCNRELCSDADWLRLSRYLHIPLDSNVFLSLSTHPFPPAGC